MEEIARLFPVHRNTVREGVKRGLPTCDDRRPMLILGGELAAILQARRLKNRQTCSPGEIYCVRCRAPPEDTQRQHGERGTRLKRGPRPFGIPREGIIDVRRAGLPEGWQAWRAKVCGRELFIFAPAGGVYSIGEHEGEG